MADAQWKMSLVKLIQLLHVNDYMENNFSLISITLNNVFHLNNFSYRNRIRENLEGIFEL